MDVGAKSRHASESCRSYVGSESYLWIALFDVVGAEQHQPILKVWEPSDVP